MRIVAKTGLVYIPEWNDNKKLPKEEQVKIHYRYLTGPEKENYIGFEPIEFDEDGNQVGGFRLKIDRASAINTGVLRIEGLEVETEGKVVTVDTAKQLMEIPEISGLYKEFSDFYLEENREMDKKKLK